MGCFLERWHVFLAAVTAAAAVAAAAAAVAAAEAEAQRSMLSGMFSFMKKTKRIRHNPESEGIYLSDLNADELDPEVAALYFPTSYRQGGHTTHLVAGSCCISPKLPFSYKYQSFVNYVILQVSEIEFFGIYLTFCYANNENTEVQSITCMEHAFASL